MNTIKIHLSLQQIYLTFPSSYQELFLHRVSSVVFYLQNRRLLEVTLFINHYYVICNFSFVAIHRRCNFSAGSSSFHDHLSHDVICSHHDRLYYHLLLFRDICNFPDFIAVLSVTHSGLLASIEAFCLNVVGNRLLNYHLCIVSFDNATYCHLDLLLLVCYCDHDYSYLLYQQLPSVVFLGGLSPPQHHSRLHPYCLFHPSGLS